MKAVIVNDMIGLITGIDKDGDPIAEFGGSYQLQISKQGEVWKVTNGVDGYGKNCRDEFKDATVTPLYETPSPPDWMSVEQIVTDEEIEKAWENANFGDVPKRTVIIETLEHYVLGYESGRTAYCIASELGLLVSKSLTDKGLKYLKGAYALPQPPKPTNQ